MEHSIPLDPHGRADNPEQDAARDDGTHEVAPDMAYKRLMLVNIAFYGMPHAGDRKWVLIDAAVPGTKALIERAAERFGTGARPAAIIMTHGRIESACRAVGRAYLCPYIRIAIS